MYNGKLVTFEFSVWQIKIGTYTVSILTVYRPPYLESNPYTGFKFVKEFGDFLGGRLNNADILPGDLNFNVEDVWDNENFRIFFNFDPRHVDCPTHQ